MQQQDNLTINLTVPTGWNLLDDSQLRYLFGPLALGFPVTQVKTICFFGSLFTRTYLKLNC